MIMEQPIKDCTILAGDCIKSMSQLPDNSVHCCITSPPYFGLRDYGHDGQIGQEETPDEFVAKMVEVFEQVRRILRQDGTLWLNLGDSYNGASSNKTGSNGFNDGRTNRSKRMSVGGCAGLKTKDLIGIPWMTALALRQAGWYLRQDIIWHKPNPMPESVTDRCTKAHEYIFLMTKSPQYFYDVDAIREPWKQNPSDIKRATEKHPGYAGKHDDGYNGDVRGQPVGDPSKGRNKRSVWTVTTKPYKGAHFATFPRDLIEPCVLAGCPEGGTIIDPFGGSGTTGEMAITHRRKAILCELNPEYIKLMHQRLSGIQPNLI